MISYQEALDTILKNAPLLSVENVDIKNAIGRVLAEDVISDINMPPFNKSAMDGYAIRRQDLNNNLEVIEIIKAGDVPQNMIKENQCAKIMTGAIIPEGADCVIIVEETKVLSDGKVTFTGVSTKNNIAYKAEDIALGDTVLEKGTRLRPQEIAVLATVGCVSPKVFRIPKIAVASTGDEIVEPYIKPENGKIRNSNAYQILSQVQNMGIQAEYIGIVGDTEAALKSFLENALDNYDVILMTGGISMGDFDYVPHVLKEVGVDLLIQKIAIKPGKPTIFGKRGNAYIFGLPGNPVSSFVIFELFAKAFIYNMSGYDYSANVFSLPMQEDFFVKESNRLSWVPVFISEDNKVMPVSYHGSAHIYALCSAKGIISVKQGTTKIAKGELVDVRQI